MTLLQQSHIVGLQYVGSTHCETEKVTKLDQDHKIYKHLAAAKELSMFENENCM